MGVPLSVGVQGPDVTTVEDRIYVVTGIGTESYHTTVESYDIDSGIWWRRPTCR